MYNMCEYEIMCVNVCTPLLWHAHRRSSKSINRTGSEHVFARRDRPVRTCLWPVCVVDLVPHAPATHETARDLSVRVYLLVFFPFTRSVNTEKKFSPMWMEYDSVHPRAVWVPSHFNGIQGQHSRSRSQLLFLFPVPRPRPSGASKKIFFFFSALLVWCLGKWWHWLSLFFLIISRRLSLLARKEKKTKKTFRSELLQSRCKHWNQLCIWVAASRLRTHELQ